MSLRGIIMAVLVFRACMAADDCKDVSIRLPEVTKMQCQLMVGPLATSEWLSANSPYYFAGHTRCLADGEREI